MFVKFVFELEGEPVSEPDGGPALIPPTGIWIFETDSVNIRKEIHDHNVWWENPLTVLGDEIQQDDEIVVVMIDTGRIVAKNCAIYVMNDKGQTIDRVRTTTR